MSTSGERLQKVLAAAGVASRRAAEDLISSGRVTVDGKVVTVLGTRVDPEQARIEVDGARIAVNPNHEYLMLNKPSGVVTTAHDPQGRPTVLDLVRSRTRLYPVGRLDADTTGLVLLTNHGELAHRLAHPRWELPRVYVAEVHGNVEERTIRLLHEGIRLDDGISRATEVLVIGAGAKRTQLRLTLKRGRKREIRRMLEAVGHPVIRLARLRFGPLSLGSLPAGQSRPLTPEEVGKLLAAVGL